MRVASNDARTGKAAQAVGDLERARLGLVRRLGTENGHTVEASARLAEVYSQLGRHREAIAIYEQLAAVLWKPNAEATPEMMTSNNNLAVRYSNLRIFGRAIDILERLGPLSIRHRGPENRNTLIVLYNLADAYLGSGRLTEGIAQLEIVLAGCERVHGATAELTTEARQELANAYLELGRPSRAVTLYRQAAVALAQRHGERHESTLSAGRKAANALVAAGFPVAAVRQFDRLLPLVPLAKKGEWLADATLAAHAARDVPREDQWLRERFHLLPASARNESSDAATLLADLGRFSLRQQAWTDAEKALRDCHTRRSALQRRGVVPAWQVAETQSLLGSALIGLGKREEGGRLLRAGYEGLTEAERTIPSSLRWQLVTATAARLLAFDPDAAVGDSAIRARASSHEPAPPPRLVPPTSTLRIVWQPSSGANPFVQLPHGNWVEHDDTYFRQVAATDEYVELYDRNRGLTVRLHADRYTIRDPQTREFVTYGPGRWANEIAPPPRQVLNR